MGLLADSLVAYAQPLIDATDGSVDGLNQAMGRAQICWNLTITPEDQRETAIRETQAQLKMNDVEFEAYRGKVLEPMIQRHREMFPNFDQLFPPRGGPPGGFTTARKFDLPPKRPDPPGKYPGTGRNAPCPCASGKKYKLCCGKAEP